MKRLQSREEMVQRHRAELNDVVIQALAKAQQDQSGVDLEAGMLGLIPASMTFREWCNSLARERRNPVTGELRPPLLVDGKPFDLSNRAAMAWIYDQIPTTVAEAFQAQLILRKCAQVGFTVMEMLATIYLAMKFSPLKVGMYVPSMQLAATKSAERFMPIFRTVPEAYELMVGAGSKRRGGGEGNVFTRRMGDSLFHFLWTSGATTTESHPMDVVTFDEVQDMDVVDMEKVRERLSASTFRYTLMGSTANKPDNDIDYWFRTGSQHRFHTRCPTCGVEEPLDDYFPQCIQYDPAYPDPITKLPGEYRYTCRNDHWIDDPQVGTWRADNPAAADRKIISIHFHQMLSPTISPREMIEAYRAARDMKSFYNRKLGKPYQDPSTMPVSLAHLNACVAAGAEAGIVWKTRAKNTFMGIDQMGAYNVAIIKERLPDGRQAVIHAEEIYSTSPFDRCSELMAEFGVQVCVVEQLPNFNDALRFANDHPGRVFLCNGYGALEDDIVRWGDAPRLDASERRTVEEERTRFTVRIDQYKAMSTSLARLTNTTCLFPDPKKRTQTIQENGEERVVSVLHDRMFLHFQKTALVTERINEGERKVRRKVVKVGIDPHYSYANMLCDVAWSRAHQTTTFILPDQAGRDSPSKLEVSMPGLPAHIVALMEQFPKGQVCARCEHYPMDAHGPPKSATCPQLNMVTDAKAPGCELFCSNDLLPDED